ncbi:DUF11 domain-containing protein, partial [Bacillus sp. D-CC]
MVTWNVTSILPPAINNGVTVNPISGFKPICCTPPIVTIPLPPPGEVTATKTVDVATGAVGDVLTYTVLISNVGIIPVTDVFFQDVIPEGTTFIEGSVTIGGVQQIGLNPE